MHRLITWAFCLGSIVAAAAPPLDDGWLDEVEPKRVQTIRFYLENDTFAGTDKYYTNGIRLAWISGDVLRYSDSDALPDWIHETAERLPVVNKSGFLRTISLSFGQKIFTPEDIERSGLIIDDRPYAGWTYLTLGFHSRSLTRMDTLALQVGIVGPDAGGEETQRLVHDHLSGDHPAGWGHQLKNEPGINIMFERMWRHQLGVDNGGWGMDWLPHLGFSLGNVYTYANAGGTFRFGWNVPRDFGGAVLRPTGPFGAPLERGDPRLNSQVGFGIYFFAGVDGRAVAQNIFLDGNTWQDSHSVDKEPLVGDIYVGLGLIRGSWTMSYVHTYRTEEFELQREAQTFGAISIGRSF